MFQLILTVISIALFSAFTAASINYIPATMKMRENVQVNGHTHMLALEDTVKRYFNATRDVNGNVVYPGDNINLASTLSPDYGFMPPRIYDVSWEVRTGSYGGLEAVGICMRPTTAGTLSEGSLDALQAIHGRLPAASAFLGTGCNATADVAGGTYLTYWVILQHLG